MYKIFQKIAKSLYTACIILGVCFFPKNTCAIGTNYGLPEGKINWKHIGVNQGLPSSETYFVYQDKKGYIWICTDRGVVRYDGSKKTIFTKKDGLTDDVVFSLHEDFKGRIWFITYNGLLSYYLNGKIYKYKYNYKIKQYLNGYQATYKNFVITKDETIYLGLQDIGAIQIDKNGHMEVWNAQFFNQLGYLYEKIEGNYFIAFNGYKKSKRKLISYNSLDLIEKKGKQKIVQGNFFSPNHMNVIQNKFGAYLIIDECLMNLNIPKQREVFPNLINAYIEKDFLWVCQFSKGVTVMPKKELGRKNKNRTTFLNEYSVSSVLKDQQGGYWFSTLENGVFYTPNLHTRFWNKGNGLFGKEVLEVSGTKENLIVSYINGCEIYDQNFKQFFIRKKNALVSTCATKQGSVFISGHGFLTKRNKQFVKNVENDVYVNVIRTNYGFINAFTSIFRVNENSIKRDTLYDVKSFYKGKTPVFKALVETKKNEFYVGNINGLFKVKNKQFLSIYPSNPLFHIRVVDIKIHPKWGIIVATRGAGLYLVKNDKVWKTIRKKNGLIDDDLTDLELDDNGTIYCSSYKGISKVFITESGACSIKNLTINDGLISNEISSIHIDENAVWLGTKNGLVQVLKSAFLKEDQPLKLDLEQIAVNGKSINGNQIMDVHEGVPSIRFNFRSLNYKMQGKQKFKYRFSQKQKWVYTDKSIITLSYPASGDYKFEVAELNSDNTWSKPTNLYIFTINPPFYKQWYTILFFFIIGIVLVYLFYRRRLISVNNKFKLQRRVNELEQKALTAQMNPHFIFNSLNSIQSFLLYQENEKAEKYLLKFSKLIRATLSNSRETFITIEQEVELLTNYIELEQMRYQHRFQFNIEMNLSNSEKQLLIPPMLIQPFVENAIIHGLSKRAIDGLLIVRFEKSENTIIVNVIDNGVGIDATKKTTNQGHRSFGTEITKERMAIYEKNFNKSFAWSALNAYDDDEFPGTNVEITIPITED